MGSEATGAAGDEDFLEQKFPSPRRLVSIIRAERCVFLGASHDLERGCRL